MRVFWVTHSLPHPASSAGPALEFELIAALARDHEIHVLSTHLGDPLGHAAVEATGATFTPVDCVVEPYPTSKLGVARALLRADPSLVVWLERDRIPALRRALDAAVERVGRPDVVQVTHGDLAPLLRGLPHPSGLLLFDALSRALETRRAVEPLARRRFQLAVESRRMRRFERRWYGEAGAIAANSALDARWVADLLDRRVTTLPNPVGDRFFEPLPVERSREVVACVGSLTHLPNADAIEWLCREIWPLVRAARTSARLVVAGRGDPAGLAVARLGPVVDAAGGELRPDVADIRPVYREAAVSVAPVRQGAGVRNKVLHAMAAATPVVATPFALEGIPAEVTRHVRTAPVDAPAFAAAIIAALDDEEAPAAAASAVDALEGLRMGRVASLHAAWWRSLVPS